MKPFTLNELRFQYLDSEIFVETFQLLTYYAVRFKFPPSFRKFRGNTEVQSVYRACVNDLGAKEDYSCTGYEKGVERLSEYVLSFPLYPGYLLHAQVVDEAEKKRLMMPENLLLEEGEKPLIGWFHLACAPKESSLYNADFERRIVKMMRDLTLDKEPSKPGISVIETYQGGFNLVEKSVLDNFSIRDLDINYGHGFEQFHNDLMARFNTSSKGLVLFHGLPGTGKTYYIRHLLRQMAVANKSVIYMPPNMVDHLTDPMFMTFLSKSVQDLSRDGKFCVLLIEDAEPLLAKREEGVRLQGVTNLLNMTDGLLNDMLNLQIICTFNVNLSKLDSALLRPGRLLARKEFKRLSELDANLLAHRLGIKHHFNKPASLGEIYAMLQNQNTLIHDVELSGEESNF
jgi:hypothetical protein